MMRRTLFIAFLLAATVLQPLTLPAQAIVRLPGTKATLECYPVDTATRAAIVCPGGSYCWLDYQGEGVEVAQWLQSKGISAYVLRYRVAGWWAWATHYRLLFKGLQPRDPYTDASRAVDYLCDSLGLHHVGIMGFSAGGHLAMYTALLDRRLRWTAPIYPVVSMTATCTHGRSRRALLGERGQFNPDLREAYSLERLVHPQCPPVFLVNCVDDPVVDYRNSVLLDSALTARGLPHSYHQYRTGGHGFGVSETKGSPECHAWKEAFLRWFNSLDIKL